VGLAAYLPTVAGLRDWDCRCRIWIFLRRSRWSASSELTVAVYLFSPVVPEVVAPLDHCADILGQINRVGGAIEGVEPSDPIRISAKIPAAALKVMELWIAKTFGGRASIELQPIEKAGDASAKGSAWLQRLQSLAQHQGYLTYAQVNNNLPLAMVDPGKIEAIVEQLKRSGIPVVPHSPESGN